MDLVRGTPDKAKHCLRIMGNSMDRIVEMTDACMLEVSSLLAHLGYNFESEEVVLFE